MKLLERKKIVRVKVIKNDVKLLKNSDSVVPPGRLDTVEHFIVIVTVIYIKKKEDPAVLLEHSWAFLIASLLDKKKVV